MKVIVVTKPQGFYEKALIKAFASFKEAKKNGYKCSNKFFRADVEKDFVVSEILYTGYLNRDESYEQGEVRTLVRIDKPHRIFTSFEEFIEIEENPCYWDRKIDLRE